MIVEFDTIKRDAVLRMRGLDMARVEEVFGGPTLTVEDKRLEYGEVRWITVGYLDRRMIVTVWTRRGSARRVISLRKANDREQDLYGPRLGR